MTLADPEALVFVVRVICGDNDTKPGAGKKRIFLGRSVWGYPSCPTPANIKFMITEEKRWSVDATLEGKFCVKAPVRLADHDDEVCQTLPVDTVTAPDAAFGGPRLGCANLGHTGAHPTGSNTAVKCTQYLKAWDPEADSVEYGDRPHFTPINGWDFKPLQQVNSPDHKIV